MKKLLVLLALVSTNAFAQVPSVAGGYYLVIRQDKMFGWYANLQACKQAAVALGFYATNYRCLSVT